jgi:hypothetical protein
VKVRSLPLQRFKNAFVEKRGLFYFLHFFKQQIFLPTGFVIFVIMNPGFTHLSNEQRRNAIQRLTALWAFTESGLGGIMHALQIPFTGLVVGGMAVIMICLIAAISGNDFKRVLKSALIVLIVKAMVSPHTPFPAYIAVSFQALLGYALFRLIRINFLSITLLSTIAMAESAVQKLLILTVFFGKSLWVAMDEMIAYVAKQFGAVVSNGSYWIVSVYLLIYIAGGLLIALFTYQTINHLNAGNNRLMLQPTIKINTALPDLKRTGNKSVFKKLSVLIVLMIGLSVILFVFADDKKQGWFAVVKTITWTISAILVWFMLISPFLTKAIQKLLKKKESRYTDEVLGVLSFLPVLKQLTVLAWQQSKLLYGYKRWRFFFTTLIHYTLTYTESAAAIVPLNDPA